MSHKDLQARAEQWFTEWFRTHARPEGESLHLNVPQMLAAFAASLLEEKDKELAGLNEVLRDKRRLARELDVAMHGEEGAAKQPSLCDLIGPAEQLRNRAESAERRLREVEEAAKEYLDHSIVHTDWRKAKARLRNLLENLP